MKIYACPCCGSTDMQMGGISQGSLFGITSWEEVCRNCGYQGQPIIFNSKEEYERFRKELKESIVNDAEDSEDIKLSGKDREVVDFLDEIAREEKINEDTALEEDEKPVKKNWLYEIILSIILSGIVSYFYSKDLMVILGLNLGLLTYVLSFIFLSFGILMWIVIIEYFFKMVINKLKI